MAKTTWRQGTPLDDSALERLRALIKERGATAVAELIGISRVSVVSAAAGAGLRSVTAIAITARLEAVAPKVPKRAAKPA